MAFEPRMHLGQKLAQVQVMSPQMQQSLAFLQAPVLDLQGMVNKELQENPVLEEVPLEDQPSSDSEGSGELILLLLTFLTRVHVLWAALPLHGLPSSIDHPMGWSPPLPLEKPKKTSGKNGKIQKCKNDKLSF